MTTSLRSTTKKQPELGMSSSEFWLEQDRESVNREALKGILSYLKYLHTNKEISDRSYELLVSQVISIFIGNVISLRMEKVLSDVDAKLKNVGEIILNDLLGK